MPGKEGAGGVITLAVLGGTGVTGDCTAGACMTGAAMTSVALAGDEGMERGGIGGVNGRCGVGALRVVDPAAEPKPCCTTPDDAGVTEMGNVPAEIEITPPHTEQRARTPVAGTLPGSTRNTERHSGQETVMRSPRRAAQNGLA